jgi:hypothetical protein
MPSHTAAAAKKQAPASRRISRRASRATERPYKPWVDASLIRIAARVRGRPEAVGAAP